MKTDIEGITPIVMGEKIYYQDYSKYHEQSDAISRAEDYINQLGLYAQLRQEKLSGPSLEEVIDFFLKQREVLMKQPIVDSNGGVAILVSNELEEGETQDSLDERELIGQFYHNLFERVTRFDGIELGRKPVLRINATTQDLEEVIQEPYFSSIITIGHGTYYSWIASNDSTEWYTVGSYANSAGHLKTGFWMQLTCLVKDESLASKIPLPYFAMRDPNNILGLDNNGTGNGLFNFYDFMGQNPDTGQLNRVTLSRIANNSFLPQLEAWRAYHPI